MNILLLSERYDIIYYTEKSIRSAFEEKGIDVNIDVKTVTIDDLEIEGYDVVICNYSYRDRYEDIKKVLHNQIPLFVVTWEDRQLIGMDMERVLQALNIT